MSRTHTLTKKYIEKCKADLKDFDHLSFILCLLDVFHILYVDYSILK